MKKNIPIDDRIYHVVGINGFRRSNLTKKKAQKVAQNLVEQMKTAGWIGNVDIYYRDGSLVERKRVAG